MPCTKTLISFSLILLIIQSSSYAWKPDNHEKEDLCNSPECNARGQEYKNNMNDGFDPCDDFYSFTCGNWKKSNPGPKYASERSLLHVLNFKFAEEIRDALNTYTFQRGDSLPLRSAQEVYQLCIKTPEYPIKTASDIAREVKMIGNVPSTPLWDMHLKYLQLSGVSAFFRFKHLGSRTPIGIVPVIMILEPSSPYGAIFHEEFWKLREKQAYTEFLFQIMRRIELSDSDAQLKQKIEKVFQFRKKFHRVINQNKDIRPDKFEPFTGQELDAWFQKKLRTQTNAQKIPWTSIVGELMKHVSTGTQKTVALRRKQYFLDLMTLFRDETEEVLAFHIQMFFVEEHLSLEPSMYQLLEKTSIEPYDISHPIKERVYPRWQKCIDNLNLVEEMEKMVYKKWFPTINVDTVRKLYFEIKTTIEKQMEESKWLDDVTRQMTLRKYYAVEEWIGFSPWVTGNGFPRWREKDEILAPEATLNMAENTLYVHGPLLLPPLYSKSIPPVYNYAGIGTTLGHELYHVIDDCGSYDIGHQVVTWWPPEMRKKCQSRLNSFIEVFNNITDREYKRLFNMTLKSDTSCSLLENYPDVMGLEAAYNAYKESAKKNKSVCKTLSKFEDYSCDQMFYVAFGNAYCGYNTKKQAKILFQEQSEHSLDNIRVNAAVAQMESFGRAFKCPVGSPMNPQEKVNLWK